MSNDIHPTAVIEDGVELDGVTVGPYAVIRRGVKIGKGSVIHGQCLVEGDTHMGENNQVFAFASVGSAPQDLKYKNEPTRVRIGNNNHFREASTVHRGTAQGHMETRIGNNCMIMANAHVAHDCIVGNNVIMANSAAIAGHVTVEDYVTLGGMAAVHQFCRIGQRAFLSAGTMIGLDVPPYCIADGRRGGLVGLNVIGLKRAGFDLKRLQAAKTNYKEFYRPGRLRDDALAYLDSVGSEDSKLFADFVRASQRGVLRPRREIGESTED